MVRSSLNHQWQQSIVLLSGTVVAVTVVAALYWAQIVFVPVALAVLLIFLLTPVVRGLERYGVGRGPSVGTVFLGLMFVIGGLGWLITRQLSNLADELPNYTANIQRKVHSLREMSGNWERVQKMIDEVAGTHKPGEAPARTGMGTANEPATVMVRPEPAWLARWPYFLGSAMEAAAGAVLMLVLTFFGLFRREDLRNRFLRLIGNRRLAFTTKAVDEAGERVSRYLLTQALVNTGYGVMMAVGLGLVGVQYALLWGFLAGVLRYIPYLGAWISIMFPMAVSIATADTWFEPMGALGVFLALELVTYNFIEPMLFKRSMGVSEVAQLVSAAFWGFLWGPVGLVLSVPLTVCLLVIGKYVPQLEFLDVLLGDDPPLEPAVSLYQRLLAWDEDDAARLVSDQAKTMAAEALYDELFVPVLNFVKRDRIREEITEEDQDFILRTARDLIDDVAPDAVAAPGASRARLLACPAFDGTDELGLAMLRNLLNPGRWEVDIVPTTKLTAEVVSQAVQDGYAAVCIGSVPPGGLAHTRYLCKRLRGQLPNLKILVGRWGRKSSEETAQQVLEAGATVVTTTLAATCNQLNAWLPVLEEPESRSQTAPANGPVEGLREALASV